MWSLRSETYNVQHASECYTYSSDIYRLYADIVSAHDGAAVTRDLRRTSMWHSPGLAGVDGYQCPLCGYRCISGV